MTSLERVPSAGTGLLAVLCDLDREWIDDFRPWLAEDMMPPRRAIGFGPAASFDVMPDSPIEPAAQSGQSPQAFVTLYVAPTLGDLYGGAYQGLRAVRAPRDRAYHEQMKNHARYTASWVGPGIEDNGTRFAPVIVFDRFDVAEEDLQAFNIWYETEYLPACLDLAGLVRMRRYLTMEGAHKHILIHEFADAAVLSEERWRYLRAAKVWDACSFAPGAPAAYRRVLEG